MRRWQKILVILLLVLGGMAGAGAWLLYTPEGARVLLKTLSLVSPWKVDVRTIIGGIASDLTLEGLDVHWTQGEVKAESLHLRWKALNIFRGTLMVNELTLKGMRIQDDRPEPKTSRGLGWPTLPSWARMLKGRVEDCQVEGLVYRRLDQKPVKIDRLLSSLSLKDGLLNIKYRIFTSPAGRIEGSLDIGFARANRDSPDNLSPNHSRADSLFLITLRQAGLDPGDSAMAASINEAAIESSGLTRMLNSLALFPPSNAPVFRLETNFSGVDLAQQLGFTTNLSGKIEFEGTPDSYQGRFHLVNQGTGWQIIDLAGTLLGSQKEAQITGLNGTWLKGSLQGRLRVSLSEGVFVKGNLQGRNLNPAVVSREWKGRINLNLEGNVRWPPKGNPQGTIQAHLLASRFRGNGMTGEMKAVLDKGHLKLDRLDLRSQGTIVHAAGVLQERVKFDASIDDLSRWKPGMKGRLSAKGWVRWKEGGLTGTFTSQGKDLAMGQVKVRTFDFTLVFDEPPKKRGPFFKAGARLGEVVFGRLGADSAVLDFTGTLGDHRLEFLVDTYGSKLRGSLSGGYNQGIWRGSLDQVEGADSMGRWTLEEPARLAVSLHAFFLSPLRITSDRGESLQASADLLFHPLRGPLSAGWKQIDLARANPWLKQGHLTGRTSGSLGAVFLESAMRLSGHLNLKATFARDSLEVDVSSGMAKFNWDERGLLATWALEFGAGGSLEGKLLSTQPARLAFPQEGEIAARCEGVDLALLRSSLPQSLVLEGRISGGVDSRWSSGLRPEIAGSLSLSHGAVGWQSDTGAVRDVIEEANLNFVWKDEDLSGRVSLILAEFGWVKASFQLPLGLGLPPVIFPAGTIQASLQGRVRDKDLLHALIPERIEKSRAEADLNLRADGTWEKPQLNGSLRVTEAIIQFFADPSSQGTERKYNSPSAIKTLKLEISSGLVTLRWDGKGLLASLALEMEGGGKLRAMLSSPEPAHAAIPRRGRVEASWEAVALELFQPLLPQGLALEGRFSGQVNGQWVPDLRLDVAGEARVSRGSLSWLGEAGLISTQVAKAEVGFAWRGEKLSGDFSLALVDLGWLNGSFQLPLWAGLPPAIYPAGPILISLKGQVREKGLVSAVFPGIIQQSRGKLEFHLQVEGVWKELQLNGNLQLTEAEAYVPSLGIRIKDLTTRAEFRGEQIFIESLQARSGPGRIEGKARIQLRDWKISNYQGSLQGERFQAVYLPDFRVLCSPRLDFQGNPGKLYIRGEVRLPELQIYGRPEGVTLPSSDVVIMNEAPVKKFPLALDIRIRLILGDRVLVNAEGIDARLAGEVEVDMMGIKTDEITARGEINVAEGYYSAYGLHLKITRGHFLFAGGPADHPTLDILALRTVGEVQAGVMVTGDLQNPVVKLYSHPAMADTDILSYIVLGQPLARSTSEVNPLMVAAGALLSRGESVALQDRLKTFLGLDTVDIQAGSGNIAHSMVTVGKYLTPRLYVGLGQSLFTNTHLLTLRYSISKHWEIETKTGGESGADLFYRIEFE